MQKRYSIIDITAYVFFLCIGLSNCLTTSQIEAPQVITMGLIFLAGIALICSYFQSTKINPAGLFFSIIILVVGVISYVYMGGLAFLRTALFILIAHGLSYKKIITYNNKMLLVAMLIIVFSSIIGITEMRWTGTSDKIFYQHVVYTFGFRNPNTPPILIFALITGYNLIQKNTIKYKTIFVEFIINAIAFYLFESRTAAGVTAVYLLAIALLQKRSVFSVSKLILWPMKYLFLIGTLLTLYLVINFDVADAAWQDINLLMSGRLYYWQGFIQTYGYQAFGNNMSLNKDPLDNSFLYLLIYNGYIALIIYNIIFLYISNYAYKKNNILLFITVIATEVYCFTESTPLNFSFSPVLLYFASLIMTKEPVAKKSIE